MTVVVVAVVVVTVVVVTVVVIVVATAVIGVTVVGVRLIAGLRAREKASSRASAPPKSATKLSDTGFPPPWVKALKKTFPVYGRADPVIMDRVHHSPRVSLGS